MPARILIVEDDPSTRELMALLLQEAGHEISDAADGAAGLQLALATRPDLLICDLRLPSLDGWSVARALKADADCAHIPLLAVSALIEDGDRERVRQAGFDGYLCKPIEPASFVAEVEAFLPAAPAEAAAPAPPTLLVVDDDAFMREVLVDALESEPWRILSAGSAEEALALLARHPIQVVLSDQSMPGMQGSELMARVSRDYPHTVRLILSGLSGPSELEAIERACAAGQADRHLVKPWAAGALREDLRAAFQLQRRRAATR
ncbi:Polar-differentiation response regulator DivK [Massilia sp. Bi118]|uniref:response regulator n=1 Tax=Massilia sp. Bi118 TaxID=2822346 RepID=UPI001DD3D924|nr:response regulator [Massilia sp. Bi118]CAH0257887.1 Polar-differentiation response regulator DivK [Massilia sp. Bi118]